MASKQKVSKPLHKSNSPVARTGQGSTLKKRLLNAKEDNLIKGREKILSDSSPHPLIALGT